MNEYIVYGKEMIYFLPTIKYMDEPHIVKKNSWKEKRKNKSVKLIWVEIMLKLKYGLKND